MKPSFRLLTFVLLLFILLFNSTIKGQRIPIQKNEILALANSAYGSDDRLINGKYYLPKRPSAKGHPYFLTDDWSDATLYIKGTTYNHIPVKYNIEDDLIIII